MHWLFRLLHNMALERCYRQILIIINHDVILLWMHYGVLHVEDGLLNLENGGIVSQRHRAKDLLVLLHF